MDQELIHYGTKQPYDGSPTGSGRYRKGSGENPQRTKDLLGYVKALQKEGMTEKEIAQGMGLSTGKLRELKSNALAQERANAIRQARTLKDKGYSNTEIGRLMGKNESSIRSLLSETAAVRSTLTKTTADVLKKNVDEKGFIDIGSGVEIDMHVSATRLKNAVTMLEEQGYTTHEVKVAQVSNPGKYTTVKVLAPPGTQWSDVIHNPDKIHTVSEYSRDGGEHFDVVRRPTSIDGKRVMIRYAEDGGVERDGTIELRRGVDDISLGNSNYAQVRIMVDGTHYLKGMAVYSADKMPAGVDIIFNTNKKKGTPPEQVFKEIKADPDNPFGALIKANGQRYYSDPKGNYVKVGESYVEATKSTKKDEPRFSLSPVNKLREEGEWSEYQKSLSSQFLSKQDLPLIKKQLNLAYDDKKTQYNEIMSLTNPALKKTLLESFADDCDASAVHLKAAALPRQATQVILPIPSMKDTEIYAPNYKNGEKVCLVRYPHGGTFEIPELTVNNRQAKAKAALGNAKDAVGINSHVAGQLSGADFDGDTVMVIPANNPGSSVRIKHDKPLAGLQDFDPKKYKYTDEQLAHGAKVISSAYKQKQMGVVSNLITDMTLKGAPTDELERAVRHSMVVIDSEKHKLDYKQSEIDNGIDALKKKWQGGGGASTIISRSKSDYRVPERKEGKYVTDPKTGKTTREYIDPKTGEKLYTETGSEYTTTKTYKNGTTKTSSIKRLDVITKMEGTNDAMTLVGDRSDKKELEYASFANKQKALGNQARLSMLNTPSATYSPEAKKKYATEVASLDSKLKIALQNAPKERQAQLLANTIVKAKREENPALDDKANKEQLKKVKSQALATARARYGAKKQSIVIDDNEWEAIQAGAISNSKQLQIFKNCDMDALKQRALPKATTALSDAKISRIKSYSNNGFTIAEIADALGISTSTVSKYL